MVASLPAESWVPGVFLGFYSCDLVRKQVDVRGARRGRPWRRFLDAASASTPDLYSNEIFCSTKMFASNPA
jgi:hypothetical protein